MDVDVVARVLSTLPEDDDHPYRTGPVASPDDRVAGRRPRRWSARSRPTSTGSTCATPRTRSTRPSSATTPSTATAWSTSIGFRDGKAFYRNRFIRTDGFLAEAEEGKPLWWAGLAERPSQSLRDGWGARGRLKDASSTDVIVHAGVALTSFYQCGDLYRLDPLTLETLGKGRVARRLPLRVRRVGAHEGRSAHRRTAVLQLRHRRALHALRRGLRRQPPDPLRGRPAARPAAAPRHGVHRELRDPQRLPDVLGPGAAGPGQVRRPLPSATSRSASG